MKKRHDFKPLIRAANYLTMYWPLCGQFGVVVIVSDDWGNHDPKKVTCTKCKLKAGGKK